jgi:transposase
MRSWTLLKLPRRMAWRVMDPKKISTMFNQEPLVGVKCRMTRGLNRPGFRTPCRSWEGWRDARQELRQADPGEGGRLVRDHVGDYATEWAAIKAMSGRLGMSAETLRKWLRQSDVEAGQVAGVTTESARQIRELKRKNAELERTIEILKEATAFFVRECAPQCR